MQVTRTIFCFLRDIKVHKCILILLIDLRRDIGIDALKKYILRPLLDGPLLAQQ
jgi:hypothetical protein